MLSAKERVRIQRYVNKAYSGMVKEGITVDKQEREVKIPTLAELLKSAIDAISYHGFLVDKASIPEANIMVRVYRDTELRIGKQTCWAYGIEVFWKSFLGMTSTATGKPIRFTKKQVVVPLGNGKITTVETQNFEDYYMKIT